MCPPLVIAGIGAATSVAGALAKKSAQDQASAANAKSAKQALLADWQQLDLREQQTQDAASMSIMAADRAARQSKAIASVSAGESGVAGNSVDALLSTFNNDASQARVTTSRNLEDQLNQLQLEKGGAKAQEQSRIDAVQPGSGLLTALQIGGAGIGFANAYNLAHPNTK